jgi:biopolymer transport protein ExbB
MVETFQSLMIRSGGTWVLALLAALSVASLAVMLDRARAFGARRDDLTGLVRDLHLLLGDGRRDEAEQRLAKSRSVEAAVVMAGMGQWENGRLAVKEAMAAAAGVERVRLERRLLFLGTVGSNAPFVGLLGTVIGIVEAFDELGRSGALANATRALAPERVMSSLAEALVATAVGLLVAIPAVSVFNYFQGAVATTLANAETLGHVLLTHVEEPADGE